jgi:hypothetical protein
MIFGYLTLATALIISLSAAVYSILGLTAIFAAAFWPIVIMGGSLEFGKIITTLWLHKYWDRAEIQYKVYLCSAVVILMLLTSMGVFGFLSKAHTDQGLVSGDVISKIAIYDDKIKLEKDNIDANRKALRQMDEAVDQVMARSTTEGGADKAVAIRRTQQKERSRILTEIGESQKKITALNEQRAPIAADVRKVEAEVGPIKYIAALIYGDNPDANVLEKSVRWVIILIVIVFDPLALTLLLAATKSLEWERGINIFELKRRNEREGPFDDWTEEDFDALNRSFKDAEEKEKADSILQHGITDSDPDDNVPLAEKKTQWAGFGFPMGSIFTKKEYPKEETSIDNGSEERPDNYVVKEEAELIDDDPMKEAKRAWKLDNPVDTIKKYERLHAEGRIKTFPWESSEYNLGLTADNSPNGPIGEVKGFGTAFPKDVAKGDMFLRVDQIPSVLYKFNGRNWIEVDKSLSDQHAYNEAYIDHLISKIESGEYDPDLLSDAERDSIEKRLG